MRYTADDMPLTMSATEMFHQSCHIGASMAGPADVAARKELGLGAIMWGSDYPHDEGTHPYSIERIRYAFHDIDPGGDVRRCSPATRRSCTTSTSQKLVPLANEVGPTVEEVQTPLDDEAKKYARRI